MKNIIKSLFLVITFSLAFTACQDNAYNEPNSFADAGFYTTGFRSDLISINVDNIASFADMSQGATMHKWIIEEGSFFLEGSIDRRDSIYDEFIKTPIALETEEKTATVLFRESGIKKVRLHNEFDEYVQVRGEVDGELVIYPSVEIDGKFVIDTTLYVDVYAKIVPEMLIRQDGVVVDHTDSTAVITVEAGGTLDFVDLTTIGRPTNRFFNIGGKEYTDSVSTVPFFKLGNYRGNFRVSRTDQNLPGASTFYRIPVTVKVIPSSLPFEVAGDLVELEDQTILVPFTGEFAPFADPKANFSVTVDGVGAIPIESVSLKSDDATMLEIKLTEAIYRNDVVKVSYDGNAAMESSDTRKPVAFTDLPVNMHEHVLKLYDFEDSENLNHITQWNSNGAGSKSTEQALNGSYSFKLECGSKGNAKWRWSTIRNNKDFFTIDAGVKVEMILSIYKKDGFTEPAGFQMRPFLAPKGNNYGAGSKQFGITTEFSAAPFNQWKTYTKNINYTNDDKMENFSYNISTDGVGIIYIDDIMFRVADYRP